MQSVLMPIERERVINTSDVILVTGANGFIGTKVVETQLAASHPLLIMGLARYLYPAYYQHPRILEGIGEAPRPPFPEGFDVEATDAGLLEKLQARRKAQ